MRFRTLAPWVVGLVVIVAVAGVVSVAFVAGGAGTAVASPVDGDPEQEENGEPVVENETGNLSAEPIGRVNGIWHNDTLEIDQSDGLTEEEMHAYVSRSMARVEYIRGLPFKEMVNVTVMSRDEFRDRSRDREVDPAYNQWNNLVWRALFLVGDDQDIDDAFDTIRGDATLGFYTVGTGNVTIVTEDPNAPVIDNGTLIHELGHALQDQHFNLSREELRGVHQDEQLAVLGLIEGDVEYVRLRYEQKCGEMWECVETPDRERPPTPDDFHFGIWAVLFQPYSDGPAYMHELVAREGWEAVDRLYENPPASTREVIHHEAYQPPPYGFNDTSAVEWQRFWGQGVRGTDTAGEASIFVMFWYQATFGGGFDDPGPWADSVGVPAFFDEQHPFGVYSYAAPVSSGWVKDYIVPYYHTETGEQGFVWVSEWESGEDADQFAEAYEALIRAHLAGHSGAQVDEVTWVLDDGPFGGAYRVVVDGSHVIVVHAPSDEDLEALRPEVVPIEEEEPPRPRPGPWDPTPMPEPGIDPWVPPGDANEDDFLGPIPAQRGMGLVVAAAAIVILVVFARRRPPGGYRDRGRGFPRD